MYLESHLNLFFPILFFVRFAWFFYSFHHLQAKQTQKNNKTKQKIEWKKRMKNISKVNNFFMNFSFYENIVPFFDFFVRLDLPNLYLSADLFISTVLSDPGDLPHYSERVHWLDEVNASSCQHFRIAGRRTERWFDCCSPCKYSLFFF